MECRRRPKAQSQESELSHPAAGHLSQLRSAKARSSRSSGCLIQYSTQRATATIHLRRPPLSTLLQAFCTPSCSCLILYNSPTSSDRNDDVHRCAVRRYWCHYMHSSWYSSLLLRRRHSRRHEPPQKGRGQVSHCSLSCASRLLTANPASEHPCTSLPNSNRAVSHSIQHGHQFQRRSHISRR